MIECEFRDCGNAACQTFNGIACCNRCARDVTSVGMGAVYFDGTWHGVKGARYTAEQIAAYPGIDAGRLEARVAELEAMNRTLAEDLRAVSTRLATAETDRDDYERRWLAECRAHGDTKRKLARAHHELGEHSLCDGDCSDVSPD